jgi:hypothetical protein
MIKFICKTVAICLLGAPVARADNDQPDIDIGGLLDLRLAKTGSSVSWLDHGLGKTRYGGDANGDRVLGRVGEAALLITPHFGWSTSAHLYLKHDADQHQPLDVVEAYVSYHPVPTDAFRYTARAGAFLPPVSFENTGPAWTSPYTITPSAINTWVGEELRTLGGEGSVQWLGETQRIGVSGALYKANDPAGSLFGFRGWAMHDFKSGLNDRMPFPPTHSFGPSADFPNQSSWLEPFREIDGRWGYYGALTWEKPGDYTVRALHYDNRANPTAFNHGQYAWHTQFSSLGGSAQLPMDVTLISQYLEGETFMGAAPEVVNVSFSSWFILLSKQIGDHHHITLRHDQFGVKDIADIEYGDHGLAWTLAYALDINDKQRLMLEFLNIDSNHPQRDDLGLSPHAREHILQASYRLFF